MRFYLAAFLLLVVAIPATYGQGAYVPMGSDAYHIIDRINIKYGKILPAFHTSVRQYQRSQVAKTAESLMLSNLRFHKVQQFQLQWLIDDNAEWTDSLTSRTRRPLWKFYREPASLLHYTAPRKIFNVRVNPVLGFRFGTESSKLGGEKEKGEFLFINTRGVEVRGDVKQVVSFYFGLTENQIRTPRYVRDRINDRDFANIPGNGYWKRYRETGIDFFEARGYVNVNVLKHFDIQFGHDRNFIGNGYRSLYLSDFSSPYLFLKTNTRVWRINYQNIFAELINQYKRGGDRNLPRKYGAFHHLNFNVTHFLDIGLFEGIIFNRGNHFDVQYLNPLIFYRAIEQSVGSPDNAFVGGDFKLNLINHISIYGQFVLDEFNFKEIVRNKGWWANKYALQVGMKYIDIVPHLDAQVEFNMARPYMYTHSQDKDGTVSNFTHYNQPLAHPLGANFYEVIGLVRYQPIPRLNLSMKVFYSVYGQDSVDATTNTEIHFGGNIFKPTSAQLAAGVYGNKMAQGVRANQTFFTLMGTYQPWHNVYVDMEITYRNKNSAFTALDRNTFYFGVGARMNLPYRTYEF